MSNLIGAVSLTSPSNGVYLGKVNLNNVNASSSQLLYTADGINISGLSLGSGLTNTSGTLSANGGVSLSTQAANEIVTCTSTSNIVQGNTGLTYDGTKLQLGGNLNLYSSTSSNACLNLSDQTSTANSSVGIGFGAKIGTGGSNIAIGSSVGNNQGTYNIAIGRSTFTSANSTAGGNAILGMNSSSAITSGSNNTIIGNYSASHLTTETGNTIIGASSFSNSADVGLSNCSTLGFGISAIVSGSNQVQLGNSATNTYVYGSVNSRSDQRDKAEIQDSDLGLDFINQLQARKFKYNYREDYTVTSTDDQGNTTEQTLTNDGSKTRTRFHYGLIAQEVKSTLDTLGIDSAVYQDHSVKGGKDVITLGYTELISPLIKAIQELSVQVQALQNKS